MKTKAVQLAFQGPQRELKNIGALERENVYWKK